MFFLLLFMGGSVKRNCRIAEEQKETKEKKRKLVTERMSVARSQQAAVAVPP